METSYAGVTRKSNSEELKRRVMKWLNKLRYYLSWYVALYRATYSDNQILARLSFAERVEELRRKYLED